MLGTEETLEELNSNCACKESDVGAAGGAGENFLRIVQKMSFEEQNNEDPLGVVDAQDTEKEGNFHQVLELQGGLFEAETVGAETRATTKEIVHLCNVDTLKLDAEGLKDGERAEGREKDDNEKSKIDEEKEKEKDHQGSTEIPPPPPFPNKERKKKFRGIGGIVMAGKKKRKASAEEETEGEKKEDRGRDEKETDEFEVVKSGVNKTREDMGTEKPQASPLTANTLAQKGIEKDEREIEKEKRKEMKEREKERKEREKREKKEKEKEKKEKEKEKKRKEKEEKKKEREEREKEKEKEKEDKEKHKHKDERKDKEDEARNKGKQDEKHKEQIDRMKKKRRGSRLLHLSSDKLDKDQNQKPSILDILRGDNDSKRKGEEERQKDKGDKETEEKQDGGQSENIDVNKDNEEKTRKMPHDVHLLEQLPEILINTEKMSDVQEKEEQQREDDVPKREEKQTDNDKQGSIEDVEKEGRLSHEAKSVDEEKDKVKKAALAKSDDIYIKSSSEKGHPTTKEDSNPFKELMLQKQATVYSDAHTYKSQMVSNYYSKITEQRMLKKGKEEALKKLRKLPSKDFTKLKKVHQKRLKELREAKKQKMNQRARISHNYKRKWSGSHSSPDLPFRTSSLRASRSAERETSESDESDEEFGDKREKEKDSPKDEGGSDILEASNNQSDPGKRKASGNNEAEAERNSEPGKSEAKEGTDSGSEIRGHKRQEAEQNQLRPSDESKSPSSVESNDASKHTSQSGALQVSLDVPNRLRRESSLDIETFIDELYNVSNSSPSVDEEEKYTFIETLIRDFELQKNERDQRARCMVGMQNESSSLWRESEAIFQKPLSSFACHQDFARLMRKYQVERPAGETLCGPFNGEISKVECSYTILISLAIALEDHSLSQRIEEDFKLGTHVRSDEDLLDPTGLKALFFDLIGEHSVLMKILKVTTQSVIAPCITRFKQCLAPLDFNSVRGSWGISVIVNDEEITVIHRKKEKASPDTEEKYGPFAFEWAIEYIFDLEMKSLRYLRPMLMSVRGSKKVRKAVKKGFYQLINTKK